MIFHLKVFPFLCTSFLTAILSQEEDNPIGLCQFPTISVHSAERERSVCDHMAPRDGKFPAETSPCPWRIFIFASEIRPLHTQPVTMGSVDGAKIFGDYIIKAKPLDKYNGTPFMGHFEPQWDASPVCCGKGSWPNMLVSARVRTSTPNETVLWTAPTDYLGRIVFVVTFIVSSRKYWYGVESEIVTIVPEKEHPHFVRKSHLNLNGKK